MMILTNELMFNPYNNKTISMKRDRLLTILVKTVLLRILVNTVNICIFKLLRILVKKVNMS